MEDLVKMLDCNWPGGSMDEDIEAYLNRLHVVVLTDTWIYYRLARTDRKALVPRMAWPNPSRPDLFIPETTAILKRFKRDQRYVPDDYEADLKWGVALLQSLAQGIRPCQTKTVHYTDSKTGVRKTEYEHAQLHIQDVDTEAAQRDGADEEAPTGEFGFEFLVDEGEEVTATPGREVLADTVGCAFDMPSEEAAEPFEEEDPFGLGPAAESGRDEDNRVKVKREIFETAMHSFKKLKANPISSIIELDD